jgi:catechol 2,3-dioxygenase-like lactoylglutathione lyase family enzyme
MQPKIIPGAFVLAIPDLDKSAAYFREVLGFRVLWWEATDWRLVERDTVRVMLGHCLNDLPPSDPGPHNWFGYLEVDDINALHAEITARGATCSEPANRPYGMKEVVVTTVDGHRIVFGQQLKDSSLRFEPLGEGKLRFGGTPAFSARRTRSATVRTPSFFIIWPRWNLIVFSTVPRSPAICLFSRPATICESTSSSRGVRLSILDFTAANSVLASRDWVSTCSAREIAANKSFLRTGFVRKSTAPAFMARTETGILPLPVRKIIGRLTALAARAS